jgi:hypothetical protein
MNRWAPESGPDTAKWVGIEIDFPMIVVVEDYHQLEDKLNSLKELGIRGLKLKEIGYSYGYCAVIYKGNLPKRSELVPLIKKLNGWWTIKECNYFLTHGEVPE